MDHYSTLGVSRDADPDAIKRAYRKLASQHHPDRGGDTARFQQIQAAYDTLSDPQLRQQYDNPQPQFNFGGGFPGGFEFHFGHNSHDPLGQFFRQFNQHNRQQRVYTAEVWVTLEQAARGDRHTLQMNTPHGHKLYEIAIPRGIESGARVRFDGLLPDGPIEITFRIHPHPQFDRRGLDIYLTVKVNIFDLILGTTITAHTIMGKQLEVTIAPRTKPGAVLRLNGHGLVNQTGLGDQYLLISAEIPDTISDELIQEITREQTRK